MMVALPPPIVGPPSVNTAGPARAPPVPVVRAGVIGARAVAPGERGKKPVPPRVGGKAKAVAGAVVCVPRVVPALRGTPLSRNIRGSSEGKPAREAPGEPGWLREGAAWVRRRERRG